MRKWRISPALKRDGSRMKGVFELHMPYSLGIYDRFMSIEAAMHRACTIERERGLLRGIPVDHPSA